MSDYFGKILEITDDVKYIGDGEDPKDNIEFQIWEKSFKTVYGETKKMDMTKCDGTQCPKKETCKRFTSPASQFAQCWISASDCISEDFYFYWPISEETDKAANA